MVFRLKTLCLLQLAPHTKQTLFQKKYLLLIFLDKKSYVGFLTKINFDFNFWVLNIFLTNVDNSIQLVIESGTIMITSDDFNGEISFSEFYDVNDEIPEPTSEDDIPLILWGDVISFEPYEIIFENDSTENTLSILNNYKKKK